MSPEQLNAMEQLVIEAIRKELPPTVEGPDLAGEVHTFALYLANSSFCAVCAEAYDKGYSDCAWED